MSVTRTWTRTTSPPLVPAWYETCFPTMPQLIYLRYWDGRDWWNPPARNSPSVLQYSLFSRDKILGWYRPLQPDGRIYEKTRWMVQNDGKRTIEVPRKHATRTDGMHKSWRTTPPL